MAAAPPLWLILRRRLRLVPEEPDAERTVAIFGAPREPPRVTIFEVTSSAHRGSDKLPYIIATAPSALLLGFSVADTPTVTDELLLVRPPGDDSTPRTSSIDFGPRRVRPATYDANSIALTFSFGSCTIAELKVTKSSDRANLLLLVSNDARFDRLFSSGDDDDDVDQWTEADLPCPLPNREREWSPCGVVDHDNNLWWFDLSWGLLSCNPTAMPIVLRFHDLPPGCDVGEPNPDIHTTRCIGVSEKLLRYVGITGDADRKVVIMWTWMRDSDGGGDRVIADGNTTGGLAIGWHKTYQMSFREIWNDASYRNTHLLPQIPEIVFVSPRNPNVVCFFQQTSLFLVDVPAHRVVAVFNDAHELLEAPGHKHYFLPWDLPPSIAKVSSDLRSLHRQCNSLLEKGRWPKSPTYIQPECYCLPALDSLDLPEFQMNKEANTTTTTTTTSSSSSSSSSEDLSRLDDLEQMSVFGNTIGLATDQEEEEYMMEASVLVRDDLEATEIILMHDLQLGNGSHGALRDVLLQQRIVFFGKEQDVTSCTVCISDFRTEDRCIRLPCKHIFHALCIIEWLLAKATCPVCRGTV